MSKWRKALAALLALVMLLSVTACSSDPATPETSSKTEKASSTAEAEAEPTKEESSSIDPFGVYDPPITITTGLRITPSDTFALDGTNPWDLKFKEYGINVDILWTADASQFESKLNTLIAAGDVPDFITNLSPQQMNTMVKADMVADLTELLPTYLTPEAKDLLMGAPAQGAIDAVTFDGKIRFIPQNVTETQADVFPLFIRQDWLKNLGLEIPKTLDDLKEIAIAFTKNDPDKNGQADTYGVALAGQKSLLTDWGGLYGFFPAYGVQPCVWYDGMIFYSKDDSGKAVWDGERPETKEGLQYLADLYAEGAIPKDFPTMDSSKITEELNGGKAGIVFGARGLPFWAIQNTIKNDPNAEWYAMNMPTKDSSHPPIFGWQPVNVASAISSNCKNPEAIIKMYNIVYKLSYRKSPDIDPVLGRSVNTDVSNENGPTYINLYDPSQEREECNAFFEAVKKKDRSLLEKNWQENYDKFFKYEEEKDVECWGVWNGYYPGPGGAFYTVWNMNTPDDIKRNVWWATPTDEMISKLQLFKKMAEEEVVKIVTGNAPVSDWDNMVEQWNKIGGDEITKVVNDSM